MKDKKDIVWSDNLFDKLVKEYANVILKISDDREKAIREMINNCEEIKLFKFEDRHLEDKKKLTNNEKKVLGSTFSSILSDDNSINEEIKENIEALTEDLPDNISSIEIPQLIKLTESEHFRTLKSKISKSVDVTSKTWDFLENNIVTKFVTDMFFGSGIGMMNLSSYLSTALSDIKTAIKKVTDSSIEDNDKLIENLNKVSNTVTFKLLNSIIIEIEKRNEKEAQNFLKKLAIKNIIFKNLDDLDNLNEDELVEGKIYLIKTSGNLVNSTEDNKENNIAVDVNDLVFLKSKNPLIWEKVKNPEKADLFSSLIIVIYNMFIKNKNDFKYITSKFATEKSKEFLKRINEILVNADLNEIQKRSECAKTYINHLQKNSAFDPLLSFVAYMSFLNNYKNSYIKFNKESSLDKTKKNEKIKKENYSAINDDIIKKFLNENLENINMFKTNLKRYKIINEDFSVDSKFILNNYHDISNLENLQLIFKLNDFKIDNNFPSFNDDFISKMSIIIIQNINQNKKLYKLNDNNYRQTILNLLIVTMIFIVTSDSDLKNEARKFIKQFPKNKGPQK
ncbi:MAG: hypothetical protein PHT84_04455 [Candidatus Pacebacteria bacterium]|nr:hypothetical protein [Candidatus Paceibacterota bacterium]